MRRGLDQEAHPHDVGQREPALQAPVGHGTDDPADRHRRGQEPEAHGRHPEPLLRIEDQHGPGRAEGDVERDDRERQRAHGRVTDEPAHALDHVRAPRAPAAGRAVARVLRVRGGVVDDPPHEQRAEREAGGVGGERQGHPDREQERADGWRDQLVRQEDDALQTGVRDAQVLPAHELRQQAGATDVGERLGRPQHEQRREDDGDADHAADDGDRQHAQDRGPGEVDERDDPPPVHPVRHHAGGDPEQEHRHVLGQERHARPAAGPGSARRPAAARRPARRRHPRW